MHKFHRCVQVSMFSSLLGLALCSCAFSMKRTQPFSAAELGKYQAPLVFLESFSESDDGKYFIALDQPETRYRLDYQKIWDADAADQTFLFSMGTGEKEGIYEYDFAEKTYRCLLEEEQLCDFLELSEDSEFASVYYCLEEGRISFLYGDMFCIYDHDRGEAVYNKPFALDNNRDVIYDWKTSQTILMDTGGFREIYEVNVYTGEKIKIADDLELGNQIFLTEDRTMGCGKGDENWFGVSFEPVLIWDTTEYKVKRFREGTMFYGGRAQLSSDKAYVMFARNNRDEPNQVLCLKAADETMCEVYTTQDFICDILWW